MKRSLTDYLWDNNWILIISVLFILFFMLGGKDIWTQEIRWANICQEMLIRHDYLHPYLFGHAYYDKPLLSYWLIIGLAHLIGKLNIWVLRLPSAIAGAITIWGTYYLGTRLISKQAGKIAAWLLIATFYFVFWARVASSDMLNVAGIVLALVCYFTYRDQPKLFSYTIFFIILGITALFKGLVGPAIVVIAIIPDLIMQNKWHKHIRWSLLFSVVPGLIIYLLPFLLSTYFNSHHYAESGLREVFQENLVRFFQPFDHKGHIYSYFIYLPIYIFPWIIFFIPALFSLPNRWRSVPANSRWLIYSFCLIFLFLTLSGSRRSYYILPLIPFAMLITAEWICAAMEANKLRYSLIEKLILIFSLINFLIFGIAYPLAASGGGIKQFAKDIRFKAEQIQPWSKWNIVLSNADERVTFYLHSPNLIKQSNPSANDILITKISHLPDLQPMLKKYKIIYMTNNLGNRLFNPNDPNLLVALIPEV